MTAPPLHVALCLGCLPRLEKDLLDEKISPTEISPLPRTWADWDGAPDNPKSPAEPVGA
jgi:hypothetical protein